MAEPKRSVTAPTLPRRLDILREMAEVYQDTSLKPMVVHLSGDPHALACDLPTLVALGHWYEKLGRQTDLIKVLDQQVEHTEAPGEASALLRRIAGIWVERFNNVNNATKPLEQILDRSGNAAAIVGQPPAHEATRVASAVRRAPQGSRDAVGRAAA